MCKIKIELHNAIGEYHQKWPQFWQPCVLWEAGKWKYIKCTTFTHIRSTYSQMFFIVVLDYHHLWLQVSSRSGVVVGVVEQRSLLHPVLLRHLVVVEQVAGAPAHRPGLVLDPLTSRCQTLLSPVCDCCLLDDPGCEISWSLLCCHTHCPHTPHLDLKLDSATLSLPSSVSTVHVLCWGGQTIWLWGGSQELLVERCREE